MKKQKRTDVLIGKEAEEFARENTNFYLYQEFVYAGKNFTLLKSLNSDEYYLAKIKEKQGFLLGDVDYFVDMIYNQPINPVLINGQPRVEETGLANGCNINVKDNETVKTLYFGDSLYQFKNKKDRDNFDFFCFESCARKPKFDALDKLSDYFSDENFVLMAKDEAFFLAFRLADDLTTIGRNLLEHKIKKEIDKRVEKYANKSSESGQMGE